MIAVALASTTPSIASDATTTGAPMLIMQVLKDPNDGGCAEESPFARYVERVRDGLERRTGVQFTDAEEWNLTFVCLPLVRTADAPAPDAGWSDRPPRSELRLESPWLRIAVADGTAQEVHAVFVWNERQMLIDQATLVGIPTKAGSTNTPMTPTEYAAYIADYERSVLLASSPEDRDRAQAAIGERVPAEMLWLLRSAWQSTRGPFGGFVDEARQHVAATYLDGYTQIALALFERTMNTPARREEVRTIAGLSALVPIQSYEVVRMR